MLARDTETLPYWYKWGHTGIIYHAIERNRKQNSIHFMYLLVCLVTLSRAYEILCIAEVIFNFGLYVFVCMHVCSH